MLSLVPIRMSPPLDQPGRPNSDRSEGKTNDPRVKPSYSAWKSPDFPNVFNAHSDTLQLFGLGSLQNFPLSEWSCEPQRSPSQWKSVKYGRQRLYQQNGASAQHACPHYEQGQDAFLKLRVADNPVTSETFAKLFSLSSVLSRLVGRWRNCHPWG